MKWRIVAFFLLSASAMFIPENMLFTAGLSPAAAAGDNGVIETNCERKNHVP
ncbi:hypothetical protein [Massilia sp. erpn]|uniref:hypothetical protein n=1 Tax=Massilia sp. erpn TaxID=2738142 RepID=UPI00210484B5|nr:hypothetical protein [Massilia sp. erpn]UTY59714.1 hypothetical protein HPQ68_22575 [Massilia sp. erpn]